MTDSQIKWASQHDWYVSNKSGYVFVNEVTYNSKTKQSETTLVSFNNFSDLHIWAGYQSLTKPEYYYVTSYTQRINFLRQQPY